MATQRTITDWYSFTVPIAHDLRNARYDVLRQANAALLAGIGLSWELMIYDVAEWERGAGRAPYQASFRNGLGITIFVSHSVDNVLVEISGQGCDYLRSESMLADIMERTHERATRLDIAVDIETDIRPIAFTEAGFSGRFKSLSNVSSPSGETVYIGSRKSERYCRVYRYSEPHPRAKYLRIEYVFKKKLAKKMALAIVENGAQAVGNSAKQIYNWRHELMDGVFGEVDMSTYEPERRSGKTLMWLVGQVAPAFRRLVQDGVIEDPEAFIRTHFLSKEKG